MRRPIEPGQYLSVPYTERLTEAGIEAAVENRGDTYGSALTESMIGRFKTGVIRHEEPWWGLDEVEYATLEGVWWFNHQQLLEPLGHLPRLEYEAYKQLYHPTRWRSYD